MNPPRDPWDGIESRATRDKRERRYSIFTVTAIIILAVAFWTWAACALYKMMNP